MRLSLIKAAVIVLLCLSPAAAQDGYFPFVIPQKLPGGSQIRANWIDAPAGKYGPVVIKNAHFYTGSRRIRFFGVNLTWDACYPDKKDADTYADLLASLGVNMVRLCFLDSRAPKGLIARDAPDSQSLDTENLARLDYFIYKLKLHGIYIDFGGLHCGRWFMKADDVIEWDKQPLFSKFITLFTPRLIELQKKFARQLLSHKNPYTGYTYANDPCVAMVEIDNENSMFYAWADRKLDNLSPYYASLLDAKYYEYLKVHGLSPADRPHYGDTSPNASNYMRFLVEIDSQYFSDMYRFMKNDLRVKSPVTGTMAIGPAGAFIQAKTDFVDSHGYWEHPSFKGGDWSASWTIGNSPMVAKPFANSLLNLAAVRVEGKPFTVTEFNNPFPSFYDAESLPLTAAFAARQDWDTALIYDFSILQNWDMQKIFGYFDVAGHPVKTVEMLAASAMFARGDVAPTQAMLCDGIPFDKLADCMNTNWWNMDSIYGKLGIPMPTPFAKHSIRFGTNSISKPSLTSDIGYKWTGDGKQGIMTADFPCAKAAVGHLNDHKIDLGPLSLYIETNFAAITAISMDGKPIDRASRVLITACGRCQNTDMVWNDKYNTLVSWGKAPALVEGIRGRIDLRGAFTVFALDSGGKPVHRLRTSYAGNCTTFDIGPELKTLWYIAIRRQ